jgi:hypothetical protein
MLVWGDNGDSPEPVGAAAYDPGADRWRELPPAPLEPLESTGSAWTGSELLVWGSRPSGESRGRVELAAYDPVADTWRELASPPLSGPRFFLSAQWTGDRLVLFGGQEDVSYSEEPCGRICNVDPVPYRSEAVSLDPATGTWQRLPHRPESLRRARAVGWTGREVLAVVGDDSWIPLDGGEGVFAYDPVTGSVRDVVRTEVPNGPDVAWSWTGDRLYRFEPGRELRAGEPASGLVVDPATGASARLPTVQLAATRDHAVVWAGDRLLVWGGTDLSQFLDTTMQADVRTPAVGAEFRHDVAAPTPPPAAFDVTVEVAVDGAAPFTIEATDPGPLGVPGYAHGALIVRSDRPLVWGPLVYDGWLEHNGGVLLSLPAACGLPDPELRATERLDPPSCGVGHLVVKPGEPTPFEVTAAALPPPHAPAPGTYRVSAEVGWWERVPPPSPYSETPDGSATVTLTYTVQAAAR